MADPGSSVKATRPRILVAGSEDIGLSQGLLRMSVRETVHGLYSAELRIGNWGSKNNSIGFLYFDRKKLDFGKAIQLKLDDDVLFDGRVSAIEADFGEGRPPELAILLEDRFQDLRMTRRTRTFTDSSDADVMRRVASDHGLKPGVDDVQGPVHKVLAQVNQSDLAFLRERARWAGRSCGSTAATSTPSRARRATARRSSSSTAPICANSPPSPTSPTSAPASTSRAGT